MDSDTGPPFHPFRFRASPTLTGMATKPSKAKYENIDGSLSMTRAILCHSKNGKEIYYQYEDMVEAPVSDEPEASLAPVAAVAIPAAAPPVASSGPVASIEDVPVQALDILHVVARS